MFTVASQIVICLLLAAVIGMIIGYFLGRISCKNDEKDSHVVEKSESSLCESDDQPFGDMDDADTVEELPVESVGESAAPAFLEKARDGGKDNLTRIKGIGVKIEEKLNALGVFHFDQIASWSDEEMAWVDDHLAFRGRIKRENWVDQAKVLAEGGETEFSKRVDAGEVSSSKSS